MDELKDEPATDTAPAEEQAPESPARAPTWEELHREQTAFAATMPEPTEAEMTAVLADLSWFCRHQGDPAIQAHLGDYVAVMNGTVLGGGDDSDRLRLDWARKLNVHPARIAVAWVDDGRDLTVTFPDEDDA